MFRLIAGFLCTLLLACQTSVAAWAAWPNDGPITLIVSSSLDSASDRAARVLAQHLQEVLQQTVNVRNIPGGSGKFGYSAIATAPPDGYTVGILNSPRYLSFLHDPDTRYTYESFKELACLTSDPGVMLVRNDSPFQTVADVVAYVRANPGVLPYATSGTGSEDHIAAYMFGAALNLDMVHVPYRSSTAAREALVHGKVPLLFSSAAEVQRAVRDNSLRCLGQFADDRSPVLPGVPTLREQGYELVMYSVRGLVMPVDGDPAIEEAWVQVLSKVAADPVFQIAFQDAGLSLSYFGPEGFCAKLVLAKSEFERASSVLP